MADFDEEGKDLYPVFLYKLVNDSLTQIDELSINNSYVENIRMYYLQKKIIIYHSPLLSDTIKFELIDFSNKIEIRQKRILKNTFITYNNWIIQEDDNLFLTVRQKNKESRQRRLIKIRYDDLSESIGSDLSLQYFLGDGYQGFGIEDLLQTDKAENLLIKAEYDKTGELFYYIKPLTEFDKKYPFQMPNVHGLKAVDKDFVVPTSKYGQYQIKINTDEFMIIYGKVREYDGNTCKKQYLIYDKINDEWSSHDFKGSYPTLRAYGNWLAGSVTDDIRCLPENKKELPITGKKYRVQKRTEWGSPADLRFKEMLMYPYGILFIHNHKTGAYIEWEALGNGERQGDSEILYIENNIVIYRINNKIYQAELIDGVKLGEQKLLIKDDRVPYIHWAFIGDK